MCSCELIPIHYDDFVLLVRRCAVIQHTAEHVVTFLCCFFFLHLIKAWPQHLCGVNYKTILKEEVTGLDDGLWIYKRT